MKIEYDKPFEVTQQQIKLLNQNFLIGGICAGPKEIEGKIYLKCWLMKYAPLIQKVINGTK